MHLLDLHTVPSQHSGLFYISALTVAPYKRSISDEDRVQPRFWVRVSPSYPGSAPSAEATLNCGTPCARLSMLIMNTRWLSKTSVLCQMSVPCALTPSHIMNGHHARAHFLNGCFPFIPHSQSDTFQDILGHIGKVLIWSKPLGVYAQSGKLSSE